MCAGLDELHELFGELNCSPVFESEPVGIRSDRFLNMVVQVKTSMPLQELDQQLKQIEARNGRYALPRKGLPLDIDVLLYGQQTGVYGSITLPRAEILKNAFVLWPLGPYWPGRCNIPWRSFPLQSYGSRHTLLSSCGRQPLVGMVRHSPRLLC